MRVGLFRRLGSFILDTMPIILVVSLLFSLFIGDMLKPDNYDAHYARYNELREEYFGELEQRYTDGEITLDQYQERYNSLSPSFQRATEIEYTTILVYIARIVLYHTVSFISIYLVYIIATKGRTFGRRMLHIELGGKVTIWRLFLREIIWKFGYWAVTLVIGGVLLDIAMISFSQKKLTLRDFVSGTYIKYEGVDYPF